MRRKGQEWKREEKRREEKDYGRVKKPHSSSDLPRVRFTNVVGVRVDVVNELAPDCAGDVADSALCDVDDGGSGDGNGSVESICALGSIGGSSILEGHGWRRCIEEAACSPHGVPFAVWVSGRGRG